MTKRRVKPEVYACMREMRRKGASVEEIAETTGMSAATVRLHTVKPAVARENTFAAAGE